MLKVTCRRKYYAEHSIIYSRLRLETIYDRDNDEFYIAYIYIYILLLYILLYNMCLNTNSHLIREQNENNWLIKFEDELKITATDPHRNVIIFFFFLESAFVNIPGDGYIRRIRVVSKYCIQIGLVSGLKLANNNSAASSSTNESRPQSDENSKGKKCLLWIFIQIRD